MKAYEIDFKEVKTYMNFYQTIIKAMGFPEWCGENPDAIWDVLTTDIEIPAIIYVKNLNYLPPELQEEGDMFLKIAYRACNWYKKLGMYVEIKIID